MPSFRRRASVLDADSVEKATEEPDRAAGVEEAKALAEAAEAEAAEAEAMAAAARARARAIRLRKQAEAAEPEAAEPEASEIETDASDVDADTVEATDTEPDSATAFDEGASTDEADDDQDGDVAVGAPEETARKRRRWLPRPSWKRVAVGLSILCICALLAASGYTVWQHRQAVQEQQRSAEFAAAGKQTVVTLMSLNFNRAQEDVQRIIDNSTGQFKDDFQNTADDFVKVAQDAKVTTEVTVNSTAVESMTDDSAVVLVAATSRVTNNAGAQQEPRSWRLSVNLQRDGGQIKMSKVEFVP